MLFILTIALANLALGYVVGIYLGPGAIRLGSSRLPDKPMADPQSELPAALNKPAEIDPGFAARPEPPMPIETAPLPAPIESPEPSTWRHALRSLRSNLQSYRAELAQIESELRTSSADSPDEPLLLFSSLQIQMAQLHAWREELVAETPSQHHAHETAELASEVQLSLDTYIKLAHSITNKIDSLPQEDSATIHETLRDGISKLLENGFPLRDRFDNTLSLLTFEASHHDSGDLWDDELHVTNRTGLELELNAWRQNLGHDAVEPHCAALLDIDRCRELNQARGVQTVEQLLQAALQCIIQQSRVDDRLARYSGQQFILQMPGLSIDQAAEQVERIRREIETAPWQGSGEEPVLTITCGVVDCIENENNQSLFQRLNEALQAGKMAGRNRTFVCRGTDCEPFATDRDLALTAIG